jgi:hypothetical protein
MREKCTDAWYRRAAEQGFEAARTTLQELGKH